VTTPSAALELGGTGSVLAIWSGLVVLIGGTLFVYGIVVVLRDRRRERRRKRRAAGRLPQQRSVPVASRALALPAGPTAGRGPLALPAGPAHPGGGSPYAGGSAHPGARAFPAGPARSRPLALPAGPGAAVPPDSLRVTPGATPGYGVAAAYGATGASDVHPIYGQPPTYGAAATGTTAVPDTAGFAGEPIAAGTLSPDGPGASGTPVLYGTSYAPAPVTPTARASAAVPISAVPPAHTADVARATVSATARVEPRPEKRSRRDDCAPLRAKCEMLTQQADAAATAAAMATAEAEEAQVLHGAAVRAAEEARQAYEALAREAAEISARIGSLGRNPTDDQQRLERETTHAAFAAYRRGDISSEQLREVFRRAEGWTPQHDDLSRRSTELRAAETEAARAREAAVMAEQAAEEQARAAADSARAFADEAHSIAFEARSACAAAADCERRGRRR